MSSFNAILKFKEKEYEVLSCSYVFSRAMDSDGRPASGVQAGEISLQVVVGDDDGLLGWMVDPYRMEEGTITFMRTDQDSSLKEVKFEDAYCSAYSESFNNGDSMPMTASLAISARKLSVGGVSHEIVWRN